MDPDNGAETGPDNEQLTGPLGSPDPDPEVAVLKGAVREIEAYAAEAGWDQPPRMFALVPTSDLLAREPGLAEALGVSAAPPDGLTPVEQESVPVDEPLEDVLQRIMWPAEVFGCAVVVERLVLPPSADATLPEDAVEARRYAETHPDRQEVRVVAGVTRAGATYCALRMRSHDDDFSVLESPDLVPALLELLAGTLEQ